MTTAPPPERRHDYWSAPKERILIQLLHWFIVLVVVITVAVLRINGDLDDASATALLGTALGHAGTSAQQKLSARSSDRSSG